MVEREPRKEIVLDSVGGLNIYGHLLWWTLHLVITKSIKSKKKESRQLVGCFLLCMGQNYAGSMFFFFFFSLLERLNQNTYLQMPIGPLGRVLKDKYQNLKRRRIWQMSKLGLEMRESSQKNKIVYDGYVKLNFIVA
jgi:hypothetical protein